MPLSSIHLCVLASGSGGNCTVIALRRGDSARLCLIDLGISPRRTVRLLAALGLALDQVDDVLMTHFDSDHYRPGWRRALPRHARIHLHARHARLLPSGVLPAWGNCVFDDDFSLSEAVAVRPTLVAHDAAGVVAYRLDIHADTGSAALGFATDLGHVPGELVAHFRPGGEGVDVLAIESNYCPRMQIESSRPEFLKRRIMGGSGHLSNQQAARAVRAIQPREHLVLLHLSRQCNTPALAAAEHDGAPYAMTLSSQFEPTPWIAARCAPRPPAVSAPRTLFAGT